MNHIAQDEGGKKKEGIEPWARKKKKYMQMFYPEFIFSRKVQPFFKALSTEISCHMSLTHRDRSKLLSHPSLPLDLRNKES